MKTSRNLSPLEQRFITEAEAGGFTVGYSDNGEPYAMGAEKTGNLFSMDIEELPEPTGQGSCYILKSAD